MKVLLELKSGFSIVVDVSPDKNLTKNFALKELANNSGDPKKPQFIINSDVDVFLAMLQDFRTWYNKPMVINCGYRQDAWNQKVGGAKNSLHKKALAVDWGIKGFTDKQYMNVAEEWKLLCVRRGIIGECNFYEWGVHLGAFADKNGYRTFQCRDYRNPPAGKNFKLITLA